MLWWVWVERVHAYYFVVGARCKVFVVWGEANGKYAARVVADGC